MTRDVTSGPLPGAEPPDVQLVLAVLRKPHEYSHAAVKWARGECDRAGLGVLPEPPTSEDPA